MNELLEQFVLECRELAQQASEDLLALEKTPAAADRLDSVFRCFHTLKGAAGIVAFPAMTRVMHAAEDVLSDVRAGRRAVTPALVGDCLASLDQLAGWLDETERRGEIPTVPEPPMPVVAAAVPSAAPIPAPAGDWISALMARNPAGHGARTAFRLVPAPDCFLRNLDPLAAVATVPDLLVLEIAAAQPWPALDDLDPFTCNLILAGLTMAAPDVVAPLLRGIDGAVDIVPVPAGLAPPAATLLEEQIRLLTSSDASAFAGNVGAAGRVAAGVLHAVGMPDAARAATAAAEAALRSGDATGIVDLLRSLLPPAPAPAAPAPATSAAGPDEPAAPTTRTARTLRVDIERIDALASLVGELVVAKNTIGHLARQGGGAVWKEQHLALDRLVTALQRAVLAIRVLPLAHTFQAFPRLVREMARDLGKPVNLVIEGEATEADKTIVEALFEPLLHLLRNALDHGIESPDRRGAAGKPAVATVLLRARREADHVVIEVADDGGGLDTDAIRRVARDRGAATADALAQMSDHAVTQLIFAPGFSTAAAVTGLSGRGVGMDAVRAAIARLGGRVSISSVRGRGTTVSLTLPFSVMLLGVMTVEAGGQAFGIPLDAVVETTRLARDRILEVGAARAVVLRGRTVPLVRLTELLGLAHGEPGRGEARIVVASVRGHAGAIEVERFGDRMDLMVKPMDGLLAGSNGFAGTAVLGDGRVLIVLDLGELFE